MTIYPTGLTGGANIKMAVENALGTPGTYYDFRVCEDMNPTFPTDSREVRQISTKGFWDASERAAQISYEKAMEGGGTISTYIAGSSSAATPSSPQCVRLLESMGCTVVSGNNTPTVLDGYTSTVAWSGAAGSPTVGQAGLIEDTAHARWPYLTYSNSGTANYDIVPTMAIPVASESGADINAMWTITPPKGAAVSSSKTLAFMIATYFPTSTESGSAWVYTGCAVSEIKPIVFESGMPLKMDCTVHLADKAFDQSGIDLTAAVYTDSANIPIIDGASRFLMGFCDLSAMPIAATRATGFRKATWNPGIKVIPVLETGASTSVNGWGGFIGTYVGSTIELTMDVNKEYWTTLESSASQTPKYIELVQGASATTSTSVGLWLPKCYLTGKPTAELWGEKEMTVTATFACSSAGLNATTANHQGNAPWYLAVSPVY